MRERDRRRYEDAKKAYAAFIALYPFTLDNLPGEVWKVIPDFKDYHGSNWGRVKSFHNGKVKIKKPSLNNHGYLVVTLYKNGKSKAFLAHVLVARLFIPNPLNLPEINHEDGIKFNCYVGNLYWSTHVDNMKHAAATGLMKSGEDNPQAKLTTEQVRYIRENPDGLTTYQLTEKFGVNYSSISQIQLGKIWKNADGTIRDKKFTPTIITDEMRTQILADYQKGVSGHGYAAVGKRFGVSSMTVWNIVHESAE